MLGGVAGGIAQTYNLDPTLVRLAAVVSAIFGVGVLLYVGAWIVIPPDDPAADTHPFPQISRLPQIVGIILIGIGVLVGIGRLVPHHGPDVFDIGWPLVLIIVGGAILVRRARELDDADPGPPTGSAVATERGDGPFTATAATAVAPGVSGVDAGGVTATPFDATPRDAVPDDADISDAVGDPGTTAETQTTTAWGQRAPWASPPAPSRHVHRHRHRPRSFVTPLTLSALLVYAGVVALLNATGAIEVNIEAALAIALGIVGVALLVSTVYGHARGLIAIGLLLTLFTSAAALIDVPLRGGIGEQVYQPTTRAELNDGTYRLAIGHLVLDLRNVPLTGRDTSIRATLGIGQMEVRLPSNVNVDVHAHVQAGHTDVLGHEDSGTSVDTERVVPAAAGTTTLGDAGVLHLDLRVGLGEVRIERFAATGTGDRTPLTTGGTR